MRAPAPEPLPIERIRRHPNFSQLPPRVEALPIHIHALDIQPAKSFEDMRIAVIDGSLREFQENPATSWEPFAGGAEGEYVSTKTYPQADARQVPRQFLPASWEPMWGIEEERPLALGNFADSMVPLHGYRFAADLRANNEFWLGNKIEMRDAGIYCGPGLWFDRETARIHIRLAHHRLEGLGDRAYRGETDPRRLPLIVAKPAPAGQQGSVFVTRLKRQAH